MLTGPQDDASDAGMTLVELVVGMVLMSVVCTLTLNFFIGSQRQANRLTDQNLAAGSARAAISQVVKTLQLADSSSATPGDPSGRFTVLSPTEVTFYSNYAATSRSGTAVRAAPNKVDFTLANGSLIEKIYPASGSAPATYSTTPTTTIKLLTGVTNTVVFGYCSSATDPSTTCTATTNPASVALVQITLTVAGKPGSSAQTMQTGVAITGTVT